MKTFVILGSALIASAAVAQETARPTAPGDPNERICVRESVIGSRITTVRRCLTRAQWRERQMAQRDEVDAAQLRQVNPQDRSPATIGAANGRYVPGRAGPQ